MAGESFLRRSEKWWVSQEILPKDSPAICINISGLKGEEEELLCLKVRSCMCAAQGAADVLFLAG